MFIVSKFIPRDRKVRKYFKKKKDGSSRLLMSLDYFLLQRMYGCMTASERINKIINKKGNYGMDKDILEEMNEIICDENIKENDRIDLVLDLIKKL